MIVKVPGRRVAALGKENLSSMLWPGRYLRGSPFPWAPDELQQLEQLAPLPYGAADSRVSEVLWDSPDSSL